MTEKALFGCEHCFQAEAQQVWAAVRGFTVLGRLVDESHLIVTLLACPRCSQRYVRIFTEMIDWTDGEDPQHTSVVPVTSQESELLLVQGEDAILLSLETFGRARRCLEVDFPSNGEHRIGWTAGFILGPHD